MKRLTLGLLTMLVVSLMLVQTADARRFGGRRGATGSHMTYTPTEFSTEKRLFNGKYSLQDIAMMRAKWMAHFGVLSHGIHGYHKDCPDWAGHGASGEGIGQSSDPDYKNCPTCIVGSTVVADGWAKADDGTIYRVRLFN
jgi:hypothetical protein